MSYKTCLATWMGVLTLSACSTTSTPVPLAEKIDLDRFMGKWYVIAHIPLWVDKHSFNAVESYELAKDGTIATTFTFNEGSLKGPLKTYRPTGFVREDTNNALWGMQFIWPIKAQYKISYIASDYSSTIVARDKLDYVWIMARKPTMDETEYERLLTLIKGYGYDISKLRRVPHDTQQTN
ncbi:MAG: lipocalin family protein [Oxalicibacterium faecigallinarum]|uniref:lipocalin family protein n=1 Tax=Oxalicibacterium faecigallinarum TaxID=573741 RepID=UPI0028086E64|nr:lipocalin family protein [Oxalicibacterium faecigallinarum]MDQ7970351.1 lipocalin family protein [Oxalicibacterium faecigallinarum]